MIKPPWKSLGVFLKDSIEFPVFQTNGNIHCLTIADVHTASLNVYLLVNGSTKSGLSTQWYATILLNLENMVSETSQIQKTTYCMTSLIGNVRNRKILRRWELLVVS